MIDYDWLWLIMIDYDWFMIDYDWLCLFLVFLVINPQKDTAMGLRALKAIWSTTRQHPEATTFEEPLCTRCSPRIGACPADPNTVCFTKTNSFAIQNHIHQSVSLHLQYHTVSRKSRALVISDLFCAGEVQCLVMFWFENCFGTTSFDRSAFHQIALCGRRRTSKVHLISGHGPRMFQIQKVLGLKGRASPLGEHIDDYRCGWLSKWLLENLECDDVGKDQRGSLFGTPKSFPKFVPISRPATWTHVDPCGAMMSYTPIHTPSAGWALKRRNMSKPSTVISPGRSGTREYFWPNFRHCPATFWR